MEPFAFTCPCCGKSVVGLPDLSYDAPVYYPRDPEKQRERQASLTADFCTLEGDQFFIRAVCRVPIEAADQDFGWGIWVSLSSDNFRRYRESFRDSDQSKLGAMFGWFCNRLPHYPDTLSLQTTVVPQDGNQRPLVYVNDVHADHPLFVEQREGMPQEKLARIYAENLCDKSGPADSAAPWTRRLRRLFRY